MVRRLKEELELTPTVAAAFNSSTDSSATFDNTPHYKTVFCPTCRKCIGQFGWRFRSLVELERAAEDGCQFCSLLIQGI
jgi:hypothetical protein